MTALAARRRHPLALVLLLSVGLMITGALYAALAPQPAARPRTLFKAQAAADYPGATWYGNNGRNYSNRDRGPPR